MTLGHVVQGMRAHHAPERFAHTPYPLPPSPILSDGLPAAGLHTHAVSLPTARG